MNWAGGSHRAQACWLGILVLVGAPAGSAQTTPTNPPASAVSVPLGRSAGPPRVEVFVVGGRIEVREHGGADIRYVAWGLVDEQVMVTAIGPGVVRLVGRARLTGLSVWVPRGATIRVESHERGGDVVVMGATGTVDIANERGSVRVSGAPTALIVNTAHGSVRVRLQVLREGPHAIAIHNGSLFLELPPQSGVDIDTRTLFNGSFVTDLPHDVVETSGGRRTRVGGGGSSLRISLWNGSLHVNRAP